MLRPLFHQPGPRSLLLLVLLGLVLSSLPIRAAHAAPAPSVVPASTITADTTWLRADSPIDVTGYLTVARGAMLTIEPGVTVRFAPNTGITVAGSLQAVGTPDAPILLTGAVQNPGSWQGLVFYGDNSAQATGVLRHTTVEYGGFGSAGGTIYANTAQVMISDSTLRHSAGAGLVLWSRASGSSITRSRIVGNAGYGLFTPEGVARQAVLATNNWWGHPSGPATDNGCNAGGQGARVSKGVAFAPFLSAADATPPALAPSEVRLLTLTPERWFAPADDTTRVFVSITARDGDGSPLPGRRTRLVSSLGSVTDGGITDAQGRAFAWLSSREAGDAILTAELDLDDACEFARSGTATVSFTPDGGDDELAPGAAAPYANGALSVGPQPFVRGVPATLSARLSNPGSVPLVVEGRFAYAQSGIGLAFGPLGPPQSLVIEPGATVTFTTSFTPPLEGHYCFSFDYNYRSAAAGAAGLAAGKHMQINAVFAPGGRPPRPHFLAGVNPGPEQLPWHPDEGIDASLGFFWRNPLGALNFWAAQRAKRDAGGRPDGPGLLGAPGVEVRSAAPAYRQLSAPRRVVIPTRPAGSGISAERAAAERAGALALASAAVNLEAATIADARYEDAIANNDLQWASLQASASDQYGQAAAEALREAARAIERYLGQLRAEGVDALPVTAAQAASYQERLRSQGLSAEEVAGLRQMGLDEAAIETLRQGRLERAPAQLAGDVLARLETVAGVYRGMADELEGMSHFGSSAPALAEATAHRLARTEGLTTTIQIGNSFAGATTIDLRVRPIDLPPDWSVTVSPATVTLQPGEQRPVTVTIQPGVGMQGSVVRAAVEGYAGGALIDGVVFSVPVPEQIALPAPVRVYLPLLHR